MSKIALVVEFPFSPADDGAKDNNEQIEQVVTGMRMPRVGEVSKVKGSNSWVSTCDSMGGLLRMEVPNSMESSNTLNHGYMQSQMRLPWSRYLHIGLSARMIK
ncbi:MAG: hypothetical protein ETSY2_48725 [Candidatus Entotheonella gemina]|uniref:Uncharacterized protein n=1 Tax=Candidatus Entotheonella gemina TaxID=1429439 RepID=W4LBB4_9BACT|nr:MAG: hypothetical protein ETSY2_48725 [Candidatus Entotheonella gemina]